MSVKKSVKKKSIKKIDIEKALKQWANQVTDKSDKEHLDSIDWDKVIEAAGDELGSQIEYYKNDN